MNKSPFLNDSEDFFKSHELNNNGLLIKSKQDENKLSKIKKILISILQKQLQKSFEIDFNEELLIKGKAYPVGTIREWQGKKYKKVSQGKWMRTYTSGEGSRGEKLAIAKTIKKIQAANTVEELAQIIRDNKKRFTSLDGSTPKIVKQLLEQAKEKRGKKKQKIDSKKEKKNEFDIEKNKKNLKEWSNYGKKRYYIRGAGHYSDKSNVYFTGDKTDTKGQIIVEFDNGVVIGQKVYGGAVKEEVLNFIKK